MTNVYLKHQYCSKFFGGKISHFTQPFTLIQPTTCGFQLSSPWFWCLNLSSDTKCCRRKCAASVLYLWINLVFHLDHSLYFLFNSCLKHLGFLIFQSEKKIKINHRLKNAIDFHSQAIVVQGRFVAEKRIL